MPNILTPLKKLLPFRRPRVLPRSRQTYIDRQGWRLTTAGGQPQLEGWYRSRYGSYFGFIPDIPALSKISYTTYVGRLSRSTWRARGGALHTTCLARIEAMHDPL